MGKRAIGWGAAGLFLGWFLSPWSAAAGPAAGPGGEVGLQLNVDKAQLAVGDSLTLSLEFKQVTGGNGIQAEEPSIATPDDFQMQGNQSSSTQIVSSGDKIYEVMDTKYTLVATQAGTETLGPASLVYQDAMGKRHEIHSNTVRVTVTPKPAFSFFGHPKTPAPTPTVGQADDGLQGVKPIPVHYGALVALFAVMALLVVAAFAYRFRRRRAQAPPRAPAPEGDGRREALKRLFNEDLPSKELCLKLSAWVRECLAERYGFPAEEYTTGEVLKALREAKASAEVRESAEKCLKACDRVLYAEGTVSSKENLKAWALALAPRAARGK